MNEEVALYLHEHYIWMSQWMNEWRSQHTSSFNMTYGWTNEWMNEEANVCIYSFRRINGWTNEQMNEWMKKSPRVSSQDTWMNKGWTNERTNEWMNEESPFSHRMCTRTVPHPFYAKFPFSFPIRSLFVRSHVGSSKNEAWEQRNKRPSCLPAVTFPLRSQVVVVHKASLALHVPSLVHWVPNEWVPDKFSTLSHGLGTRTLQPSALRSQWRRAWGTTPSLPFVCFGSSLRRRRRRCCRRRRRRSLARSPSRGGLLACLLAGFLAWFLRLQLQASKSSHPEDFFSLQQ